MPFADLHEHRLHYLLEGDSALPVVALSNSLGADVTMWGLQVPALLPYFRVLRYDTRGHGQSSLPSSPTLLPMLGEDLLTLLDILEIPKVHLCGVSLGGLTAMWCALHAGHRLHSLVLSNTAARIGSEELWDTRIAAVATHGMEAIADAVPSRWFTPAYVGNPALFGPQKQMLLGCSASGYIAACAAIRDADLRAEVQAIDVPTLILTGAEDVATPPAQGLELHAAIGNSAYQQLSGAHLCNLEFPKQYNEALLAFLRFQKESE